MKITSSAFKDGMSIPEEYTKDGADKIPPLHIEGVPAEAKSLALIMDDPDAPKGTFTHWLVFNIDPETADIEDNEPPSGAVEGTNDYGDATYGGPKPPSGTHHYYFKFYALSTTLTLDWGVSRADLERQIKMHTIDTGKLMGIYSHKE